MEYFVKIFEKTTIAQLEDIVKIALDTIKDAGANVFDVDFFGSDGKYCASVIYLADEELS